MLAHLVKPGQVVGRDGLLEPADPILGELLGDVDRLLGPVGAVGVHEQLHAIADRLARDPDTDPLPRRIGPDLHLHARDAFLGPASQLLGEPLVGVGDEAAAAVDRHRVVMATQQRAQGHPRRLRLRSQRATSSAAIAIELNPGRPLLRIA